MRRNKKQITTYFILFSLLLIGVVYAILQANLQINGTAKIQANTWDIHFDNIQVNENSVSIGTGDSQATIDPENNCKVDFEVTLSIPGDFYEFTIDVVNAGTIDGMIGELNKTLKVNNELVNETPNYLNYSVAYADGIEIEENHKLSAGETETYKVRLEFKTDIEELPDAATITTSLEPQFLQADSSSVVRPVTFEASPWNLIVEAYNSGNTSVLQAAMVAGTTREVQLDMDNNGTPETTAHVRIANLSSPAECSTTGFSQTACGFVLEFSETITTHYMNPAESIGTTYYQSGWNMGGWPASSMRTYVSTNIYNALPTDLKNKVIDTTVVSGHGNRETTNFISLDKLFLLDGKEIYGTSYTSSYNTAKDQERQLDYYLFKNVTTSNYSEAIKKNLSDTAIDWWLRSGHAYFVYNFISVSNSGDCIFSDANETIGVSPAFRIAE